LVQAIFSFDWKSDNVKVPLAYRYLITTITSSNATMIIPAFQMLVRGFVTYPKPQAVVDSESIEDKGRSAVLINIDEYYQITDQSNQS